MSDNYYQFLSDMNTPHGIAQDEENIIYRKHPDGSPCYAKDPKDCPIISQHMKADEADTLTDSIQEQTNNKLDSEQIKYNELNREDFINAIKVAKESQDPRKAWRVDVHEKMWDDATNQIVDDMTYSSSKNFTTQGGSTVSVKPDGDIISVCKNRGDRIRASELMEHAVKNGGTKLDSFAGNWQFYRKCGFEPISWTPFDKRYAPDGWKDGVDAEEPVIFFAYTGNKRRMTQEESDSDMASWLQQTPPFTGDSGYGEAMEARDKMISNLKQ